MTHQPTALCSFTDQSTKLSLEARQCQLVFQELVDPKVGGPPYLISKGPGTGGFSSGAPLVVVGPSLPGFTRYLGSGLFGQPGFPCNDSRRWVLICCLACTGSAAGLAHSAFNSGSLQRLRVLLSLLRPHQATATQAPCALLRLTDHWY